MAGCRTVGRVYAVLDNLSTHRAVDVLLFQLTHPRWEFVFQPTYAAYLNLIEPWWKSCGHWPSRGVVSRVGPRSAGPWRRPRPTGRRTNIPFSWASGDAIAHAALQESLAYRQLRELAR